jgi:hypothetical protein
MHEHAGFVIEALYVDLEAVYSVSNVEGKSRYL